MEKTTILSSGTFGNILQENKGALSKIKEIRNSPITTTARNIIFAAVSIGGIFFITMFVFQVLTGMLALIGVAIVTLFLFFGLRFIKNADPLIKQKSKNFLLKKMVEEAKKNSVEQLQNHVLSNVEKLSNAKKARDKMGVLVEKLKSSIDFDDNESNSNKKKIEIYTRVKDAYSIVKVNVENAKESHNLFEEKVNDYKDLDKFTKIANEAMSLFDNSSNSKLNEMLSLESFEHIDTEFNTAIVTIENNAKDMEN